MAKQKIFFGILLSLISCTLCKVAHYGHHHYKGAKAAHIEDFPFMVSIHTADLFNEAFTHNSGGSLITSDTVLTAAQYVRKHKPSGIRVVAGISNLKLMYSAEIVNVSEIFVHEGYQGVVGVNDIAILKLETPIRTIKQFAVLPAKTEINYDDSILLGWEYEKIGNLHKQLHKIKLPVLNYSYCADYITCLNIDILPYTEKSNMCTSNIDGHVCPGDEGGPLIQNGIVVGIASWFPGYCGNPDGIVIFTRVDSVLNFIYKHM